MLGLGGWIFVLGLSSSPVFNRADDVEFVILAFGLIPVGFGCLFLNSILRGEGPCGFILTTAVENS